MVHILQPVGAERGEGRNQRICGQNQIHNYQGVVTLQGGSQLTQIRLVDARESAALLDQVSIESKLFLENAEGSKCIFHVQVNRQGLT